MITAFPPRVMNYKVSAVSLTCELIAIGQLQPGVGDCASTVLDLQSFSLTRKCVTQLKKVVGELIERIGIQSPDEFYKIEQNGSEPKELSLMTVDELYRLYREWPLRHLVKCVDNKLEEAIVCELATRKHIPMPNNSK